MNILIDTGHPADFLLFKEFAFQMHKKGNKILFTARRKDVLLELLADHGFDFISFGSNFKNLAGKIFGIAKFDLRLLFVSLSFKPDIYLSAGSIYASHVSFILRKPHIVFEDTGNLEQIKLYRPFASVILTSSSFRKVLGEKQLYYKGYHELSYLHPNYFKPDKNKIKKLTENDKKGFIILRFVSWNASHDIGLKGFSLSDKLNLVKKLSAYVTLYISSESELPEEIENYRLPIPAGDLHHALAFARLVIGEGATVAAEAAVLGTPAIYINPQPLGYLDEMESYGLVWNYRHFSNEIIDKAKTILTTNSMLKGFMDAQKKLLSETIDVTAFMVWFIENYPESAKIMRENPDFQYNFR
jgi:uncharacterized protein